MPSAEADARQFAVLERAVQDAEPDNEISVVSAISAVSSAVDVVHDDVSWIRQLVEDAGENGLLEPATEARGGASGFSDVDETVRLHSFAATS